MGQAFSVRVYGTVDQQPPYEATNGNLGSVQATFPSTQCLTSNFPSAAVNVFPIAGGVKMTGGVICYGVVEVPATGLNQLSEKFITHQTADAIATLRNA